MIAGFVEFEFDLPEALLAKLVRVFESISPAALVRHVVRDVPDEQGVYKLFLSGEEGSRLVYIGKTDAGSGLRSRLGRHATKIQHRVGLDPANVLFKAVRVFVSTAVDLEAQLIAHYGGLAQVSWNGSGFGSNDPGRERDTTTYKAEHFDAQFPIDTSQPISFEIPAEVSAAEVLRVLKRNLPYLLRFEASRRGARAAHPDLEATMIAIDPARPPTPESLIGQVVEQLPPGWRATRLPSHTIIYKDDPRVFPSGRLIARSPDR